MKEINRKIARGVVLMVLMKFTERSLGLVSTIILARLLFPADFGVIAMAVSLIAVLELLGSFGFDVVLIQKRDPQRRHFDTAWSYNVLFALGSAALLLLLAGPTAGFYDEPRLEAVIWWLALGAAVQGFENIGVVAFRKDMAFEREFRFRLIKKLSGFLVTVPLAFALRNYWALVAGMLTARIGGVVASYVMHEFRPRFSLAASGELFRFSRWLLLNNVVYFLRHRASDFIIGRISGAGALGLYSVSYQISNLPTSELAAPINRAVFPGYARMSADRQTLRQGYLNVIAMIALIAVPVGVGIAATADLLVAVFLGGKWTDAAPVIALLALYGTVTALKTNAGSVYLALAKPHYVTWLGVLQVSVLIPALILLTGRFGVLGAAWACLGQTVLLLPVDFAVVLRVLDMRVARLGAVLWRPAVSAALMYACLAGIRGYLPAATPGSVPIGQLAVVAVLGALVYTLAILALWQAGGRPDGAERFVLSRMRARIGARLRSSRST